MKSKRILIVEDEIILAKGIRSKLHNLGYAVVEIIPSGEESIVVAQATKPDLVLMDIMLQGHMDGIEAAKQIHQRFNIPIIFLSALADNDNLSKAKVSEPYGYLVKPVNVRELRIAIEIALHKHEVAKKHRESWEDIRSTSTIQRGMLPQKYTALNGNQQVDLDAFYSPAKQVGGDFYEYFFIDDKRFFFAIGDVSDKGMPAALFMAMTKSLIRAIVNKVIAPHKILNRLNNQLCRNNESGMFVSVFIGILNVSNGKFIYSNGGHMPPYIVLINGDVQPLEVPRGLFVGIKENVRYQSRKIAFPPGANLYILLSAGSIWSFSDFSQFLFFLNCPTKIHALEYRGNVKLLAVY